MSRANVQTWLEGLTSSEPVPYWHRFLEDYSGLIHQAVRLYERDEDRIADAFVFVCDALQRHDFRRLRRFRPDGAATFDTWLRAVTRNLCVDWRRSVFGRSRLFKVIDQLSPVEQLVFRSTYHYGLTAHETHRSLQAEYPDLTRERVEEILEEFARDLSPRQQWLASSSKPVVESLEAGPASSAPESERPLPAPTPSPESVAADSEDRERLRAALPGLEPRWRLALRMRYEQDLSLAEIARLLELAGPQGASREIEKALTELRKLLSASTGEGELR